MATKDVSIDVADAHNLFVSESEEECADPEALPQQLSRKRVALQSIARNFGLDPHLAPALRPFDGAVGTRVKQLMQKSDEQALQAFGGVHWSCNG